jgi:HEAT repeat protein
MSEIRSDSGGFRPQEIIHNALCSESRAIVARLLNGATPEASKQAIADLEKLADKERQAVASYLVVCLPNGDDQKRAWSLTALGTINAPHTVNTVAAHLDPVKEPQEWVRYWAAIALAKMQPPDLKERLEKLQEDKSALVRAIALRLLIETGAEEHIEHWLEMANDVDWISRFAAAKVLRRNAGHKPLSESAESRFLPVLVARLYNTYELEDCQYQAARALGNMRFKWTEAIAALGDALRQDVPDRVRRASVEELAAINKPETKQALLRALQDKDAEIRVRAAKGLGQVLGVPGAVSFITEHVLEQDQPLPEYLDALRRIDNTAAAHALSEQLMHPDPKIATRASQALAQLGGEAAIRTLQAQRTQALDTYTQLLGDADKQIMAQFNQLMAQARAGFTMSMTMHGVIFAIGVVVLSFSLYVALSQGFETFERYVGIGAAIGSLGTLLLLFYRDPLKNIRESVTNLVKVNVIFLGYVRQINQIDATFKHLFLASAGFGAEQMNQTVLHIQGSVKQTMEEVKTSLNV